MEKVGREIPDTTHGGGKKLTILGVKSRKG